MVASGTVEQMTVGHGSWMVEMLDYAGCCSNVDSFSSVVDSSVVLVALKLMEAARAFVVVVSVIEGLAHS